MSCWCTNPTGSCTRWSASPLRVLYSVVTPGLCSLCVLLFRLPVLSTRVESEPESESVLCCLCGLLFNVSQFCGLAWNRNQGWTGLTASFNHERRGVVQPFVPTARRGRGRRSAPSPTPWSLFERCGGAWLGMSLAPRRREWKRLVTSSATRSVVGDVVGPAPKRVETTRHLVGYKERCEFRLAGARRERPPALAG